MRALVTCSAKDICAIAINRMQEQLRMCRSYLIVPLLVSGEVDGLEVPESFVGRRESFSRMWEVLPRR